MIVSDDAVDLALRDVAGALGDEPADLVLHDCSLVNVTSNETYRTSIAIRAGRIVAIRQNYAGTARRSLDCLGLYAVPGLVDMTAGRPEASALVTCAIATTLAASCSPAPDQWRAVMQNAAACIDTSPVQPLDGCADFESLLGLLRNGTTPFIDLPQVDDPVALFNKIRDHLIDPSRLRFAGLAAVGVERLNRTIVAALSAGLTVAQVYRMASFGPALSFGVDHMVGAIAPGRRADILLLLDPSDLTPAGSIRAGHASGVIFAGES